MLIVPKDGALNFAAGGTKISCIYSV